MSGSDHEDIRHHVKVYLGVFGALMILTILTVAISYLHLSAIAVAVGIAMIVATVKGSMVAAYFMHLKSERPEIFWLLLLTASFWVLLMFMPVLMYLDSFHMPAVH
jgi:cytochrome c oxidase subunit IV